MFQRKISAKVLILAVCVVLASCKKGGDTEVPIPITAAQISVLDVSQPITATNTTMQFYLNSNKTTTNTVSIDYALVDGTALSPKDFVASSGTATILPGKTQTTIEVQIKGDPTNLRNPKSCTLASTSAKGTLLTEDGTYLPTDNAGYITPSTYPGYTLLWSDEFSASNLDLNVWNQEIGNGGGGWGNNELEYYTNSAKNTLLSNGNLIIEARREAISGFNYSSARLTTQNKKTFKFGRIDIRAKLPVGKGIWPALWMLGANITSVNWPACGEIDIMELVGTYPGRVSGTMHWKNGDATHGSKGSSYNLHSGDFSQQFHVFSIIWAQDVINWYVDDVLCLTVTNTDTGTGNYPFNANQFFIFNVATGGDWPGSPDATTSFPERMFVDYVRVFQ